MRRLSLPTVLFSYWSELVPAILRFACSFDVVPVLLTKVATNKLSIMTVKRASMTFSRRDKHRVAARGGPGRYDRNSMVQAE